MIELKLIKQMDKYGCTIACLSMLTGTPYFEMRDILHRRLDRLRKIVDPQDIGLSCRQLKNTLKHLFGIESEFIKFHSLERLETTCVLYICPLAGPYDSQHTIIYNHATNKILDPTSELRTLEDFNVTCCLSIQPGDKEK